MIDKPKEVSEAIRVVVEAGKRIVLNVSPNTKVTITSTDAAEVQQVLEALEPVEEDQEAGTIRHMAFMPLLHAYGLEPVETKAWMRDLLELMEDE